MTRLIKICILVIILTGTSFAQGIFGYWQIDFDNTKKAQTALLVYEYKGLVYGKVVAIYNKEGDITDTPALGINKANGVEDSPTLCGLDIIWGLKKDGEKYTQGTVINPDTGNTYKASLWLDKETQQLVLRGELLFFGQDTYLYKVSPLALEPACIIKNPKPNIPKVSFWSI